MSTYSAYQQLEQKFSMWAQTQAAFTAAIVVGSRVRIDPPPDEWSDLDVIGLWRAKHMCDAELKQHLLRMLEWHAASNDTPRDIWYDGRYLET